MFLDKAVKEIVERHPATSVETASEYAKEMWAASQAVSGWFKYRTNPYVSLTIGCLESNYENRIFNKCVGNPKKIAPFTSWSAGFFHLRTVTFLVQAEALGIKYEAPLADYMVNHPKDQIWAVTRHQGMWLQKEDGDLTRVIEIYRYGEALGGKSGYYKAFKRIYKKITGHEPPTRAAKR